MTLVVACAGCVLALIGALFLRDLSSVAAERARAQTAADAAALAAAAEVGPYGEGRPESQAIAFARLNGARVLECDCPVGSPDARVEVAVGAVVAEARAFFDAELLAPAGAPAGGLHPALEAAIDRLIAAARGRVWLVSGFRSRSHQARLWAAALRRYGGAEAADDWVAPPGHSLHERGLAVDLGGDLDLAAALVRSLGLPLHRPLDNEPWHFELMGSRP